jgi:hypothetical protein
MVYLAGAVGNCCREKIQVILPIISMDGRQ